jgi:hypothetical protein
MPCHAARPPSRPFRKKRCRAFFSRTLSTVRDASLAWAYIFSQPVPWFVWIDSPSLSCTDLATEVKRYLSTVPSEDPAELMAFQSFKKLLPDSCSCMEEGLLDSLVEGLSKPSPSLPKGYLAFVKREVSRLFPKAWDSSYEMFCRSTSPPLSAVRSGIKTSCKSFGCRSTGGCLNAFVSPAGKLQFSQADFLDAVLGGKYIPDTLSGELMVVQSSGKPRPLSKFDAEALFLKPLHKTIYGRLSRYPWLCRGKPDLRFFRDAGFREGSGVLVSGDYKSATDGLSQDVARVCLETLLSSACFVPDEVRGFAVESLTPFMSSEDRGIPEFCPSRGQMMGSYLSFPLLCLQNYLAFRWICKQEGLGKVPLAINGDDILFQSSVAFGDRWMETVESLGFTVERTKTGVSWTHASLNSTLFGWDNGLLAEIRTVRFGMLRRAEHCNSLGQSFSDFLRGLTGDLRWRAARVFFERHVGELRSCRFSLPSLGFRGALAHRLARLFGLDAVETDVPAPPRVHDMGLPPDLVSEVPIGSLSSEERWLSADETASWKWNRGWCPVDRVRSAALWALDSSLVKQWHDPFSRWDWAFWASDAEFSWRLSRIVPERGLSRKARWKSFSAPFPVRDTERVLTSIVDWLAPDFGRGFLPSYNEALETTGWYEVS